MVPNVQCIECGREFAAVQSPDPERCGDCYTPVEPVEAGQDGPSVFVEDPHDSKVEDVYDPNPDDLEPGDYE